MMGTLAIVIAILDLDDGTIMIMMLINILPLLIETSQRQKSQFESYFRWDDAVHRSQTPGQA